MKIRSNRLLIGLVVALASGWSANSGLAATNRIYVATNGNDAWSGTLMQPNGGLTDGPKSSLTGARDAVRTILAQGGYKWPTVVQIAGGTYVLTNALTLGLSDSAGSTNSVVYQAAPGAQPVFTGGRRITGWTAGASGRWTAFVPGAGSDTNYFEQLFIDGRRATRALSPNTDYYYVQTSDAVLTNRAFGGYAADVALLAALTPTELSNVAVVVSQVVHVLDAAGLVQWQQQLAGLHRHGALRVQSWRPLPTGKPARGARSAGGVASSARRHAELLAAAGRRHEHG